MTGRCIVTLLGADFMPEKQTAEILGISLMKLRRTPSLQHRLRATKIKGHPYYCAVDVREVRVELDGYIMRSKMRKADKPGTLQERRMRGEVNLHGIICYPRKRVLMRKPVRG